MERQIANYFVTPMGVGALLLFYKTSIDQNGKWNPFELNNLGNYQISAGLLFSLSIIYFIIDLVLLFRYISKKNYIYILHHCIAISSIFVTWHYYYVELIKYLIAAQMFELSTPLLNTVIINHHKGRNNWYTKLLSFLFVIIYTLVRIIFGTYLVWNGIWDMLKLDWYYSKLLIILPITIQALNYMWFVKIIRVLIKQI